MKGHVTNKGHHAIGDIINRVGARYRVVGIESLENDFNEGQKKSPKVQWLIDRCERALCEEIG